MKIFSILLICMLLLASMAGCGSKIDASGDVGIRGTIRSISASKDPAEVRATILVEGTPEENKGLLSDKASVTLTKDTVLVQETGKKYFALSDIDLLAVGQAVEVIFSGPVAESYPVQGSAKVVRLP